MGLRRKRRLLLVLMLMLMLLLLVLVLLLVLLLVHMREWPWVSRLPPPDARQPNVGGGLLIATGRSALHGIEQHLQGLPCLFGVHGQNAGYGVIGVGHGVVRPHEVGGSVGELGVPDEPPLEGMDAVHNLLGPADDPLHGVT